MKKVIDNTDNDFRVFRVNGSKINIDPNVKVKVTPDLKMTMGPTSK